MTMKKTTNAIQEHYMIAKAHLETLETQERMIDRQYIIDNGITNPDGSTPRQTYCINDEAMFDDAINKVGEILESSGLWSEILTAREVLKIAEAKLIQYGLSIAPAGVRKTLEDSAKTNYTTRLKIIDLVMKLDASTVKA